MILPLGPGPYLAIDERSVGGVDKFLEEVMGRPVEDGGCHQLLHSVAWQSPHHGHQIGLGWKGMSRQGIAGLRPRAPLGRPSGYKKECA